MGQRLPQLVPILSLGCSLYSESETIHWLEFSLTLHMHIGKKKKKGQTLNPSGAPALNKTFKQLFPDSSSSSSSLSHTCRPTLSPLPPTVWYRNQGEGKDSNLKQMFGTMSEVGVETIGRIWTLLELPVALTYCQG